MDIRIVEENGVKMAVLPSAELEEMLEELEDYKILPRLEAELAALDAGLTEALPSAFCEKLWAAQSNGELITLWRQYRGLSKAQLAKEAGITGQYVSMIESGKREGSLTHIKALATALNCDMDDLVL